MKRYISWPGWLWIMSMAALGAWVAVMALDDKPATIYLGGAIIIPNPVEDGGRVTVHLPIRRLRNCPGVVHRALRDAETGTMIAQYDPVPTLLPATGTEMSISKTFEVPEGLPARVQYEAEVCFSCNQLQYFRPICTTVPPVIFRVVPRRG